MLILSLSGNFFPTHLHGLFTHFRQIFITSSEKPSLTSASKRGFLPPSIPSSCFIFLQSSRHHLTSICIFVVQPRKLKDVSVPPAWLLPSPSLWPSPALTWARPLISLVAFLPKPPLHGNGDGLGCPLWHPRACKRVHPVLGARGISAGRADESVCSVHSQQPTPPPHLSIPLSSLPSLLPTPTISAPPPFFLALLHTQRRKDLDSPCGGPWCSCPPSQWQPSLGLASLLFVLPAPFLSPQVSTHTCAHTAPFFPRPAAPALQPGGVTTERFHSPCKGDPP